MSGEVPVPAVRYRPRRPDQPIFGLFSAVESFVAAYLRHVAPSPVTIATRRPAHFATLAADAARIGVDPARLVHAASDDHAAIGRAGALLHHDPTLFKAARARPDPRAYSLIGVTHSLSSRESWQEIEAFPAAPLQPWDALVCTSTVARAVVDRLLDGVEEQARRAGGIGPLPRPARPIIPLGIDADALAHDPARRARWRRRLAIAEDECAVLCLGRLSIHAKAHPFPMFAAVAEAARTSGRKLILVLIGQAPNRMIADAYRTAADRIATPVPVAILEGPTDDDRADALSGADAFLSLADSVQETFGLAPVEAMAAGLPAIVTDWNGYRDTVRHGIDGFRVPTLMAAPPAGAGIAEDYVAGRIDYDRFCGATSQLVAVDVRAAATAIAALAEPERRRSMGAEAAAHARAAFGWPTVLAAYRALWEALAEERRAAPAAAAVEAPAAPPADPLVLFDGFATRRIAATDGIAFRVPRAGAVLAEAARDQMFRHAFPLLPAPSVVAAALDRIDAAARIAVGDLVAAAAAADRPGVMRLILLLAKRDLVSITPCDRDS